MSGKKFGGDKNARARINQRNPRNNKKGGKPRRSKKMSSTARFNSVNKDFFGGRSIPDWKKIRNVQGFAGW